MVVACLEELGPLNIGVAGILIQQRTGIPGEVPTSLSPLKQILEFSKLLKSKFRGLKKVLEGFPDIFDIGTDHIINPTIRLRERFEAGDVGKEEGSITQTKVSIQLKTMPSKKVEIKAASRKTVFRELNNPSDQIDEGQVPNYFIVPQDQCSPYYGYYGPPSSYYYPPWPQYPHYYQGY
jgi:hypothetical protein